VKAFTELFTALDETTKTNAKIDALVSYFQSTSSTDAAWAIWFLSGRKLRQVIPSRRLAEWASREAAISDWLFEESYSAVGDLAETIALLLPYSEANVELSLSQLVIELEKLRKMDEAQQRELVLEFWQQMNRQERFVFNKLITGGFRVGVSQQLVIRALAKHSGVEAGVIAHRLMGNWEPTPEFYAQLTHPDEDAADVSRPYPFFLASPLEDEPSSLGDIHEWQAE